MDSFGFAYDDLKVTFQGIMSNQPLIVLRAPIAHDVRELQHNGVTVRPEIQVTSAPGDADTVFKTWSELASQVISAGAAGNHDLRILRSWTLVPGDDLKAK